MEVETPYEMTDQRAVLMQFAKTGHGPCGGTGLVGWKDLGREAIICVCVLKKAEEVFPALEQMQQKLQAQIEEARNADKTVEPILEEGQEK